MLRAVNQSQNVPMIFALPGNAPFTPTRWQPRMGSQRWFGIPSSKNKCVRLTFMFSILAAERLAFLKPRAC